VADIQLDERFDQEGDQGAVDEGTAFKVAPTGGYNVQLVLFRQEVGADKARSWEYDRAITTFQCPITVMGDGERVIKIGSAMINMSHEIRRVENGDLDKLSKRYTQLVDALQKIEALPKTGWGSKDVWEAAINYPVHVFVTESFKIPNEAKPGEWTYRTVRRPDDNEEIKGYKEQGYTAKNFVQSISRYRQDA